MGVDLLPPAQVAPPGQYQGSPQLNSLARALMSQGGGGTAQGFSMPTGGIPLETLAKIMQSFDKSGGGGAVPPWQPPAGYGGEYPTYTLPPLQGGQPQGIY